MGQYGSFAGAKSGYASGASLIADDDLWQRRRPPWVQRSGRGRGGDRPIRVTSISVTPGQDDVLDFETVSGGTIDLSSLTTINSTVGNGSEAVRFFWDAGTLELASVQSARHTEFYPSSGATLNLGDQSPGGVELQLYRPVFAMTSNATVNVPALAGMEFGYLHGVGGVNDPVGAGSTFHAPAMTSIRRSTLNLGGQGTLVRDTLSEIDDARIYISNGEVFNNVSDTDYLSTSWWGSTDLLRAQNPGTRLELPSLQTMTYGNGGGRRGYNVRAEDGAVIDLSGVTSISVTPGQDDVLDFETVSGGTIDLSSLTTINSTVGNGSEAVRFFWDAGTLELASVQSARHTEFYPSSGATLNLGDQSPGGVELQLYRPVFAMTSNATVNVPALAGMEFGYLHGVGGVNDPVGAGSTFHAPAMTSIRRSTLNLGGQGTLVRDTLSEIDDARIYISNGEVFNNVSDTDYLSTSWWGSTDLLRAQNPGTRLELPSLQTMTYGNGGGRRGYSARAEDGAVIDLSGVTSISVTPGQDDVLDFEASALGRIDLSSVSSLNEVAGNGNERVRFFATGGGAIELGSLQRARRVDFSASDLSSSIAVAGDFKLESTSSLSVTHGAELHVGGDFEIQTSTDASFVMDAAVVRLTGSAAQRWEVAGSNDGLPGDGVGNFGIGQLVVGQSLVPTTASLLDVVDNGNRGPMNKAEASTCTDWRSRRPAHRSRFNGHPQWNRRLLVGFAPKSNGPPQWALSNGRDAYPLRPRFLAVGAVGFRVEQRRGRDFWQRGQLERNDGAAGRRCGFVESWR